MSPYSEDVASSSDGEGAPETLSLVQSKWNAKTLDNALNDFTAAEKERRKERNRTRDRKLKERAAQTRHSERVAEERDDAHARMERAMRDAEQEKEDEDEGEDEYGSESEDNFEGSSKGTNSEESEDEAMEMAEDGEDGIMVSDNDDASQDVTDEGGTKSNQSLARPKKNHHHLPDHLFTSAFTPQAQPSLSNLQPLASVSKTNNIVRKRKHRARAKDLIVGSRVIRTLADSSRSGLPTSITLPPPKVKKFMNRSLNIKGNQSRIKGWERRPANLGVSKRDGGPALGFVRGQQGVSFSS
ncbi:hypothetical protein PILCRDRAFT_827417 [Piloderma croceum F 1598]|uniref:Uncharacterized protein n=1 Tax=Piloderma croceum (strain F 1598) TaxID=765440 RepID=A0A0C3BDE8_PILCF|nr:hypothetical protein PILCRDRAFT_827417 [Piloderma croceum F 1598]